MNANLAIILLLWGMSSFRVAGATLRWDDPNQAGTVRNYKVYRRGPLPADTPLRDAIETDGSEVDALQVFAGAVSGRYAVSITCIGTNGVESDKSQPLVLRWDLKKRIASEEMISAQASAPEKLSICQTLAQKHESQGVVKQIFQDKAHAYVATRFKAEAATKSGICRVDLELKKVHEPKGDLTVFVWGDYKAKPAELIATSPAKIPASGADNGCCSAPISFRPIAGQYYWIGVSSSAPDAANNFLWFGGGGGMRCHSADGIVWVFSASEGMNFRFYQ